MIPRSLSERMRQVRRLLPIQLTSTTWMSQRAGVLIQEVLHLLAVLLKDNYVASGCAVGPGFSIKDGHVPANFLSCGEGLGVLCCFAVVVEPVIALAPRVLPRG